MWPFSKKVPCFQCDRRIKERDAILRRGFMLCSAPCVTAFLAANQFPRPRGDGSQHRLELGNLLVAALGELGRIPGAPNPFTGERKSASGLTFRVGGGGFNAAAGAAVERQKREEAEDAIARFNAHVTESLPYLAALGLTPSFELLDTIDVDALTRAAKSTRLDPIVALQKTLLGILDGL